jgi:pyridoxal phosphate enzyme (YggS family)
VVEGLSPDDVACRVLAVRQRILSASERCGRDSSRVRLMAVTKNCPRTFVEAAVEAGVTLFGENRVQEAERKYEGLTGSLELHLIGHLQRNKAREASGLFACIQSIDKTETAKALNENCAERGAVMDILLEYNTSGEESKNGFRRRDELLRCLDAVMRMPFIRVRGLMTIGPLDPDPEATRRAFKLLAALHQEIAQGVRPPSFDTLSMGMSGDFETAIEEGSTLIRVGTALFGTRG